MDLEAARDLAVAAARAPREQIMVHFRSPALVVETKGDDTPVTAADRAAEQAVRRIIEADPVFGRCSIVGEEFGHDDRGTDHTWLIDPIDGTRAFSRGIPTFGTLVALVDNVADRAVAGAIHLTALQETYAAARGHGATCNGAAIRVSTQPTLAGAFIATAEPEWFDAADCAAAYRQLCAAAPGLRGYGDCFGHAMVARGGLDGLIDPLTNAWDVRATEVIVEEAGGKFRQRMLSGKGLADAKLSVLFGAPAVVDEIADLVGF